LAGPKYDPFSRRTFGLSLRVWTPYNRAMEGWLSGIAKEKNGHIVGTIPVVHATPEKAFARRESPLNESSPDIPMISFYLSSLDMAFDRVNGFLPSILPFERTMVPGSDRVRTHPRMLPVNLNYSVSLWAKHIYETHIVDWDLLSRMRPYSYLNVYGADCPLYFESTTDSSNLEPGASSDREIRRDYSFRIEGWLPLPYTEEARLKKITIAVTDDEGAGDEPENTEDPNLFPEWALPAGALGGVVVTQSFVKQTNVSDLRVPKVESWEHTDTVEPHHFAGPTVETTDVVQMPDGSVVANRGVVAIAFDLANTPPWNPSPGAPLLVWQPRDETDPGGARYGSAFLYRKIRTRDGNEFHGVVPTGRFAEPARLTANGIDLYEVERIDDARV